MLFCVRKVDFSALVRLNKFLNKKLSCVVDYVVNYVPNYVVNHVVYYAVYYPNLQRKIFLSESQLSPIVKSNLVEITRIPV